MSESTVALQWILLALNAVLPAAFYRLRCPDDRYFLNPVNAFWGAMFYFGAVLPAVNLRDYNHLAGGDVVTLTLSLYLLTNVSAYVGNRLSIGRRIANFLPVSRIESASWLNLVAAGLALVGLCITMMLISAYGGLQEYFDRKSLRLLGVNVSHYLTVGPRVMTYATLVGLSSATLYGGRFSRLPYFTLSVALLAWFVAHGSRSSTLLMSVVVFGACYAPKFATPSRAAFASWLTVVVVLIGFIGSYRGEFSNIREVGISDGFTEVAWNSVAFLARAESDGNAPVSIHEDFGMAVAVVRVVPERMGYDYGYMLLQPFTQWVPRALWSSKVYPDGEAWDRLHSIAGTSRYVNAAGFLAGPAPTIVGKYFYVGGVLGVVIGAIFSGLFLRIVWIYVLRCSPAVRAVALVACAPMGYMEANNPSLWLTFWLPSAGVVLLVTMLVSRARRV